MTDTIAEFAASRIEGSPSIVGCRRMSSGFANANYRLETSAGTVLLRDCKSRHRSSVENELDVLEWLRSHQFPAAAPIRFEGGERWIHGPDGSHLVLLEWLEGSEPTPTPHTAEAIAHALADLHQLPQPEGDWWRRANPIAQDFAENLVQATTPGSPEAYRFFVENYRLLEDRLSEPLPKGFVHGDLFTDNTLFDGDRLVGILDFECACEEALLFDVAMTIHGFCFPDERWRPDLAEIFLGTYQSHRPLSGEERDLLPCYLRWCPLIMMGWHLTELLRRPDPGNQKRAAEHGRRVECMKRENWKL